MTPKEFKRLYRIISILLEQGIDELVPARYQPWPGRLARRSLFWLKNKRQGLNRGARIRLAFEALGPIFIKFGQMLSTRRDLLPPDIAEELALLQDRVPPFCGQAARRQIEASLGCTIETLFDDFDETPLASASIAQVHTARLKENGREIVIKVIRPDIEPVIEADLRLMQALARLVARFVPQSGRLRPIEVVEEYRKTILDELNLMREAANAIHDADEGLRRIPIVVLSTSESESDIQKTYDEGVNSFITKPAGFEELVEMAGRLKKYWLELVKLPSGPAQ